MNPHTNGWAPYGSLWLASVRFLSPPFTRSREMQVTSYKLQATSYKLQATSYAVPRDAAVAAVDDDARAALP